MTDLPESSAPESGPFPASNRTLLWLAIALVGAVAAFSTGFPALGEAWVELEYSHGPIIPLLALFLFLRQLVRAQQTDAPSDSADNTAAGSRWPGLAVTLLALAVAVLGSLAQIPDIVTYGMIMWVFGMTLTGFGFRRGWRNWPAIAFLVFMLPLPAVLYWKLSIELQFLSSQIGVAMIRLLGIPVLLEGNVIDLGTFKLQVAEACSGLRYLFPFLSFSFFFAALFQGRAWQRIIIFLSAAPITVAINSFRIGLVGVLVDRYGIEQAEGFLHYFEGWVLFMLCVLILLAITRLLQWIARDRRPFNEVLDLSITGIGPVLRRQLAAPPAAAFIAGAVATVLVGAAWHLTPSRAVVEIHRDPLVLFPRALGDWTSGPQQRLDPVTEAVLKADDYFGASYAAPGQPYPVSLFIAYYIDQTKGSGIHSPEVCIPAGGWEMSRITRVVVPVAAADGSGDFEVPVNRAVIQKGLARQLVYYWFEERGRRLTSDYEAKVTTMIDSITRGRTDGALVRLVTQIAPGESEANAEARLNAFMMPSLDVLRRFVPE